MENGKTREKWIDILKGVLIILVVLGHSATGPFYDLDKPIDYIYLFHMPAFFMISGYLFKYKDDHLRVDIIKKAKRLILPYIAYISVINLPIILIKFIKNKEILETIKSLLKLVYGGKYIGGYSGALWFLTCLFFVEIIFIILLKFLKTKYVILFIIILNILAHIQAIYLNNLYLPLAIDIALLCISFFAFGFYCKKIISNKKTIFISILICFIFIILKLLNKTSYGLELWQHHYKNLILDFIIPLSFTIILANICKLFEKSKCTNIIAEIGRNTLPIMCLHVIVNKILIIFLGEYNSLIYTLIGVIIPFIIAKYIFNRFKIFKVFL